MFKAIKEFFTGKKPESKFEHPLDAVTTPAGAPYKVPEPAATTPIPLVVEPVQPVVETKVDPVAVALDLEPLDLSAPAEPAKKPRKPRAPKTAVAKPAVKKAAPAKKAAAKKPAARTVVKKTK
jgi:hypothetical protein